MHMFGNIQMNFSPGKRVIDQAENEISGNCVFIICAITYHYNINGWWSMEIN